MRALSDRMACHCMLAMDASCQVDLEVEPATGDLAAA